MRLAEAPKESGGENAAIHNPLTVQGVEAGCDLPRLSESRAGDRIRTGDVQLGNAAVAAAKDKQDNDLRQADGTLTARLQENADPDLARVVAAWPALPEHIKAAVLALVRTAGGT